MDETIPEELEAFVEERMQRRYGFHMRHPFITAGGDDSLDELRFGSDLGDCGAVT